VGANRRHVPVHSTALHLLVVLLVIVASTGTAFAGGNKGRLSPPSAVAANAISDEAARVSWNGFTNDAVASYLASAKKKDTEAPSVAIASPANGADLANPVTLRGTADDNKSIATVEVSLDGGDFQRAEGTSSWTFSVAPAVGSHRVAVRATDSYGSISPVVASAFAVISTPAETSANSASSFTGDAIAPTAYTSGYCTDGFAVLGASGSPLSLPVCTSRSLGRTDTSVTRAVIVIHGDSRNATGNYKYVVDAASATGHLGDTIVVAPQFMTSADLNAYPVRPGTLHWSDNGWKIGDQSLTTPELRPEAVSSFTAVDQLIVSLSNRDRFPNLRDIVVVGHSAGGQFTNRYAAGTTVEQQLGTNGTRYHYVVANPSSYLYFSAERPTAGSTTTFASLSSTAVSACSNYNTYRYGLKNLNEYMGARGAAAIDRQYGTSDVTLLLGALDTDTRDPSLDSSCAGEWQGPERLSRGSAYHNYLALHYGNSVYEKHHKVIVADVGHSAGGMLKSIDARPSLFG